jgi:hypothetical protein
MDRLDALAAHLRTLPTARVAALLRQLPPESVGAVERPADLLPELGSVVSRPTVFEALSSPQYDLLAAAAEIAGPEPGADRSRAIHGLAYVQPYGLSRPLWLDTDTLLSRVDAAHGPLRPVAEQALDGLFDLALLWPGGSGRHHLALGVDTAFGSVVDQAPGVNDALSRAYELPELRRIALTLGLDPTKNRRTLQAEVVTRLSDSARVRALMEAAPPGAVELVERLTFEGGVLGTYCFEESGPDRPGGPIRFRFRPEGAGDPDTDWLAERGLLVPIAPERAMLPREVLEAVRADRTTPLATEPPVPAGRAVDTAAVHAQGQAALLDALSALDRLVTEIGVRPAALRKSGGMTVRDRKRLAKALGTDQDRFRLWAEIARAAGLLAGDRTRVTLDPRAGAWSRAEAADRVVPLLRAWWDLPDAPTWWPYEEDPIVLGGLSVTGVVALRQGLLRAMADLPPEQGVGVTSRALSDGASAQDTLGALESVVAAAAWYRPAVQVSEEAGPLLLHTLHEAELLGLAAHGAPTRLGRVLATGGTDESLREALGELLPPVEDTARFQGDMTAMVTGTPSARLEALLSAVAHREGDGYASTWRLSPASVRRALHAGHTAEELITDLAGAATDGTLPQTVEYLVRDIARGHGRMSVLPAACCVRSTDPGLIREMAANRGLGSLRLRAVADTVLVSAEPVETTLEALRRQGYAPVVEDETGDTVVERAHVPDPGTVPVLIAGGDVLLRAARSLTGQS